MVEKLKRMLHKEKILFAFILIWVLATVPNLPNRSEKQLIKETTVGRDTTLRPMRGVDQQKLHQFVEYVSEGKRPSGAPINIDTTDDYLKKARLDYAQIKAIVAEYSKSPDSKSLYWRQIEIQTLGLLNLQPPSATDTRIAFGLLDSSPDFSRIKTTYRLGNLVASTYD